MSRRVVLVAGPPAAGKTTWVREQASPDDVVVDLDDLAQKFGSQHTHNHPDDVLDLARNERARLEAGLPEMESGTAWVIRTAASPDVRGEIAERIGATEVAVLATPEEQALARAGDRTTEQQEAIRRWWQEFSPRNGETIIGADAMSDTETVETTETVEDTPTPESGTEDKPLGPEGEKALEAFKQRAREAEKKAKRLDEVEAELAKFREDAMSEQERAIEQARREAAEAARAEALTDVNERLFRSEVKAASAGKVVDPDLFDDPMVAKRLLGLDEIPLTDQGDIDTEAISGAVDALVESKPHLAVSATRTPGSADQGPRGGPKAGQLSRSDLQTMSPEQIAEAKAEGRLDTLLGR